MMGHVPPSLILVLAVLGSGWASGDAPNINYSHNMRILKLPANTAVGTLIYRLKGSDPDSDKLTFGTTDPVASRLLRFFSLSFREADVYLMSPLSEPGYNFTIFVTDGKTRTQVDSTIIVTKPEKRILTPFFEPQYLFSVLENARKNTTVGFVIAKERSSSNLPVRFELRGSEKFTIRYVFGPKGASKAEIILVQELDYEKQNLYALTVLAINAWTDEEVDTRNIASLNVLVTVKDIQDTPPRFHDLPNMVRVPEDAKLGVPLVRVYAEDGDFTDPRNITFSLEESNFTPFFAIHEESGEIMLKKPTAELKKRLPNRHIFLLPVKASEVLRESDRLASMSTTVQLAFVLMKEKNNLHEDFLNRSVSFILNDKTENVERRIDDIEKALTQITGGHVSVHEVHEAHEGRGSLVHAWILYPSQGTVDLRNLQKAAAAILGLEDETDAIRTAAPDTSREKRGQQHSDKDSIHTASVIHHEYQALVWVIVFFIILIILFLLFCCCIWCWYWRSPVRFKAWLDGAQRQTLPASVMPVTSPAPVLVMSDRQSLIQHKQSKARKGGLEPSSSLDSDEVDRGLDGYTNQGFKYHDKVKKIRPPRQTRARLKQGLSRSITTMNTNDMVYPEDSARRPSKPKSSDSSFDDDEEDESRATGDREKGKRTEIMYIRSPPESYDENTRSVGENEVTCAPAELNDDAISSETYMRRSSTKQVSFRMQALSTPQQDEEFRDTSSQEFGKRQRSSSNETVVSVDLVRQPDDSAFESVPEPSRMRESRTPASVSSTESRSLKYVTAVSLPGTVDDDRGQAAVSHVKSSYIANACDGKVLDEANKSDSDSGIGRGSKLHPASDLNIKNKSLMERKNIFAIAYDGVRTQRIRSAESDRESV